MVHATAVEGPRGERLRVGMVGGGRSAFIGAVHRMAMRLDDLIELKAGARSSDVENARVSGAKGLIFVTLNNAGYPMVRQAREMIEGGEIGGIRVIYAAYVEDWLTLPIEPAAHKQAEWRTNPTRAGASACLADISVHAHSLALFVTGLELDAVSAGLTTFVPDRRLDDNAHVLMLFAGGARGVLAASQVAVGNLNNLSLKVYGWSRGRMGGREARNAPLHALQRTVAHLTAQRSRKHPAHDRRLAHA